MTVPPGHHRGEGAAAVRAGDEVRVGRGLGLATAEATRAAATEPAATAAAGCIAAPQRWLA
jgi:hypothetical protein